MAGTYRDLRIWQESMQVAVGIYGITLSFPKHELYGLTNQMRRASVSVPSNIAEGKGHRSDQEFSRYLLHARGSLLELETQVSLAARLQYMSGAEEEKLLQKTASVARGLNALIRSFAGRTKQPVAGQRPATND